MHRILKGQSNREVNLLNNNQILVEVKNIKKYFPLGRNKILKAIDDVSLHIQKGETLGLVGESGCGKTTMGRVINRIYQQTEGQIFFDGNDISDVKKYGYKRITKDMQMIFQDPYTSLDARMTTGEIIDEGMEIHNLYTKKERMERVYELLSLVGLNKEQANRFPHEFSGGSGRGLESPGHWQLTPSLLPVTSRFRHWMCRCSRKLSTC